MLRKFLPCLFILILGVAGTASAQWNDLRNVYFDTLRAGFSATPVGVDQMKYTGNQYINSDDSVIMRYATAIVQYDIDFYADFELIPLDSFYIQTYEIREMDELAWKRLGADWLVRLEAELLSNTMRVRWRIFDTGRKQQFARGTVERPKADWRDLAHQISNEIVHRLTGEPGIFLSKICYIRRIGEGKEVFLSDYDGSREKQLTNTGTINLSPTFAPDYSAVYFTSYLSGDPQLHKVDLRTLKISQIGKFPGLVAAPAISPDGNKIACVLTRDGNSEIYVLDMKGHIIKRLTRHFSIDTAPTWSPDGRQVAFSSDRSGSPQIYVMDSDGLKVRRLTYQGGYNDSPIWARSGDRITFVSRTKSGRFDLASIRVDGTDYRVMTEVGMNENPHFSPDGKHIVFSSTRLGPRELYTMDITGQNQRRLTRKGNASNPYWGPIPD